MFSVPGWSVSTSSLVTEQARPRKTAGSGEVNSVKASKKRKRNQDHDANHDDGAGFGRVTNRSNMSTSVEGHGAGERPAGKSREGYTRVEPKIQRTPVTQSNKPKGTITPNARQNSGNESKHPKKRKAQQERVGENIASNHHDRHSARRQESAAIAQANTPTTTLTPLQAKMRSKLTSARFRHLNETLYTTTSSDALNLFTSSPELFADYHAGFSQQVKDSWPQNPVDEYIKSIKTRDSLSESKSGLHPLPRRKTGSCTIADLGCGDAPLARGCQSVIRDLKLKFHSYDLHAANSHVTKADISNLPLRDGEADIAVFCLSLMGTNWINFVEEAWRILRGDGKGEVWVAEVKSRFGRATKGRVVENSVGKRRKPQKSKNDAGDEYTGPEQFAEDERNANEAEDETDISLFVKVFTRRGFQLREGSVNKRNKMFVSMIFTKSGIPTAGKYKGFKWTGKEYQKQQDGKTRFVGGQKDDDEITPEQEAKVLKPCVYKIR